MERSDNVKFRPGTCVIPTSHLTHTVPEFLAAVTLNVNANPDDYDENDKTPNIHMCPGNKYDIVLTCPPKEKPDQDVTFLNAISFDEKPPLNIGEETLYYYAVQTQLAPLMYATLRSPNKKISSIQDAALKIPMSNLQEDYFDDTAYTNIPLGTSQPQRLPELLEAVLAVSRNLQLECDLE